MRLQFNTGRQCFLRWRGEASAEPARDFDWASSRRVSVREGSLSPYNSPAGSLLARTRDRTTGQPSQLAEISERKGCSPANHSLVASALYRHLENSNTAHDTITLHCHLFSTSRTSREAAEGAQSSLLICRSARWWRSPAGVQLGSDRYCTTLSDC